ILIQVSTRHSTLDIASCIVVATISTDHPARGLYRSVLRWIEATILPGLVLGVITTIVLVVPTTVVVIVPAAAVVVATTTSPVVLPLPVLGSSPITASVIPIAPMRSIIIMELVRDLL